MFQNLRHPGSIDGPVSGAGGSTVVWFFIKDYAINFFRGRRAHLCNFAGGLP